MGEMMKKGIVLTGLLMLLLILACAASPAGAFPRRKAKKIKTTTDTTSNTGQKPHAQAMYGFRIGACMATIHGDVKDRYSLPHTKTALTLGVFARIGISHHAVIQPEFFYAIKGAQDEDGMTKFKLSYLELSALMDYQLTTRGKIRPSLFVGPIADFLTNAQMADDYGSLDVTDYTAKYDVGFTAGSSLNFPVGRGQYIIDARYTFGFLTVDDSRDNLNVFNRAFSLTVGYAFR